MFNKKSILVALTLVATITLLGFGFRNVYSQQNGTEEEEYKQYVLTFIDEFQAVQEKDPIIFTFDKDNPEKTRRPIDLRLAKLDEFNYTNEIPAKYADIHKQLLEAINSYKQNYHSLYEGITSGDAQLVGTSVGNLYGYDFVFQEIENSLRGED
jgi:hypothetical protein